MTTYNWLTLFGVPGIIMALGSFILLQIRQNKAMKDGIKAILHDKLLCSYRVCRRKGYTTSYDRDNFECMYIQYKALRGNGVMEDVRRRFLALPLR